VPGGVLGLVLALAVLEVRGLHEDHGAVGAGALAVGVRVVDADDDRVRLLAGTRRPALVADVADDEAAVAEAQLRAVALADLQALLEAEGRLEPRHRLADVGIDEDRDDRGGRHRAVRLQGRAVYGRIVRAMAWLPDDFVHPLRVDLPTGHHLRPIRESDVAIDYPAVMGSRERLWAKYGEAWGWPAATMSYEADRVDLARHEAESAAHQTFNYAVLDEGETALLGCVYIDPPGASSPPGSDAVASWWVVDAAAGTELEHALDAFVPAWLRAPWGFRSVHFDP